MRRLLVLLVLAWALPAGAIDPSEPLDDPEQQAIYENITKEVRCLVCQNQSIADSTAPLAADLRREIKRMIVEGQSEGDIKIFLVERYGDFVLYRAAGGGKNQFRQVDCAGDGTRVCTNFTGRDSG